MKINLTIFILFFAFISGFSQTTNSNYDPELAKKLGADERGMKNYVLVMLKTGSNTTTGKAYTDSCFAGHMSNMNRLVKEGKLIVAGPLGKNERSYRGIFILDVPFEEATSVLQTDPAIHARLLDYELFRWYGSAALPVYLDAADKIRAK
jgi:uncharacterized protein